MYHEHQIFSFFSFIFGFENKKIKRKYGAPDSDGSKAIRSKAVWEGSGYIVKGIITWSIQIFYNSSPELKGEQDWRSKILIIWIEIEFKKQLIDLKGSWSVSTKFMAHVLIPPHNITV